jgi:hypothetical protein
MLRLAHYIASASVTEDPSSNPAGVRLLREHIAALLCKMTYLHKHCLCVEKRNEGKCF